LESDGAEKNSTKDESDFNVSYEKHGSLVVCLDPCLFEIRERVSVGGLFAVLFIGHIWAHLNGL